MGSHSKNHRSKNSAISKASAKELLTKNRIDIKKCTNTYTDFFILLNLKKIYKI